MASISELEAALVNADAAGDASAARQLASEITRLRALDSAGSQGGMKGKVAAFATSALEGIPIVGPAINAATDRIAAFGGSVMGDNTYDQELARIQGVTNRAKEENPNTALAGSLTGGVLGTAPLVAAAPAAFGAGAGNLGARSVASALTGGGIGAGDAAVRSGGDPRAVAVGGSLGAGFGAAGPTIASGVGRGVTALADKVGGLSKPTGVLAGLPKPAADFAIDTVGDPARMAAMRSELDRLGPQAMLADVSPEWMGVARGAASQPGMRDEIAVPLLTRDAGKNARLRADMDRSIGPAPVPSEVAAGIEANQAALAPQYQQVFQNARAVDTTPIAHALEADAINLRGPAQRAAQQVRQMLDITGEGVLDPNPYTLFQTRQAIDGLMAGEVNPQVVRVLANARRQVDDTLAAAVPGIKDVDAQFAELARQNTALGRGQQVLDSGRTAPRPQELAAEVSQGALPQGNQVGPSAVPLRLRQGARAEIDRVVGTSANDPAAMQKLVRSEGDWNRDRLRTLFGPGADDVLNSIDRETAFYRTGNRVTSGSDTAMASRFGNFLDDAAKASTIPTDSNWLGLGLRGAQKAIQKALGSNAEERAAQFARDLGRLSVAQGSSRDAIIQSLMDSASRRQSLDPIERSAREVARLLLASSPPAANQKLAGR